MNDDSGYYMEAFYVQKVLMTLTGLWPKKNRYWYTVYGFIISFVIQEICTMSSFLTVFSPSTDLGHGLYILFCTFTIITYGIKVIVFYVKRFTFYEILTDLEQPLFQNYGSDGKVYMEKAILISNRARKMIQYPCIVFITCMAIFPILDGHSQRPLPHPIPINVDELPLWIYLCIYFLEIFASGICACNNGNMDTLVCSFIALGTAQLQILANKLKSSAGRSNKNHNLENYRQNDEEVMQNLKNCVEHHVAITKYVERLEKMFSNICLAQFLTSVVVICLTGFSFLVVPVTNLLFTTSVAYFVALTVEISIYCLFGDELIIESLKISDACYMSEWDNCGPEVRKTLLIIMENSKRPLMLTAGKFASLSRDSLVKLAKSSFSYFTVLRKLYGGQE